MRALYYDGKDLKPVSDYPKPVPDAGECLVEVTLAGICDTDVQITRGYMAFKGIPGHEFVGVVREGPAGLLGKRVVGEINCPCGTCDLCRHGLGEHCAARSVLGIAGKDGCFAEYLTLPAENLHSIPDKVSDEAAVFVEPLAAAVNVMELVHIRPTDRVLVLGDGKLGLLTAAVLFIGGYDVVIGGRHPERARLTGQIARAVDIYPPEDLAPGYDVIVEATGSESGLIRSIELARPAGTIILKTTIADVYSVNLAPVVVNELNVIGNRCGPFQPAIRFLETGLIKPEPLISDTVEMADVNKVILRETRGLKFLVKI